MIVRPYYNRRTGARVELSDAQRTYYGPDWMPHGPPYDNRPKRSAVYGLGLPSLAAMLRKPD